MIHILLKKENKSVEKHFDNMEEFNSFLQTHNAHFLNRLYSYYQYTVNNVVYEIEHIVLENEELDLSNTVDMKDGNYVEYSNLLGIPSYNFKNSKISNLKRSRITEMNGSGNTFTNCSFKSNHIRYSSVSKSEFIGCEFVAEDGNMSFGHDNKFIDCKGQLKAKALSYSTFDSPELTVSVRTINSAVRELMGCNGRLHQLSLQDMDLIDCNITCGMFFGFSDKSNPTTIENVVMVTDNFSSDAVDVSNLDLTIKTTGLLNRRAKLYEKMLLKWSPHKDMITDNINVKVITEKPKELVTYTFSARSLDVMDSAIKNSVDTAPNIKTQVFHNLFNGFSTSVRDLFMNTYGDSVYDIPIKIVFDKIAVLLKFSKFLGMGKRFIK